MELKKRPQHFDIYLIGDINESSYMTLKKDIDEKVKEVEKVDEENSEALNVMGIEFPKPTINVQFNIHVSTYDGSVIDGLGICDLLNRLDREDNGFDVRLICEGKVMSMGIPIICSVRNVVSAKHTTFMIHQLSSFSGGKLEEMKEDVEEGRRLWDICKDIIVSNSRITMDTLNEWEEKRMNIYFDTEKALEYGLINDIF